MSEEFKRAIMWDLFDRPNTHRLWLYLLVNAAEEECYQDGSKVMRGQIYTSLSKLSQATGLTKNEVRTALSHLLCDSHISHTKTTQRGTQRGTHITICNYDSYAYLSHNHSHNEPHDNHTRFTQTKDKEINRENETKETTEREISSLSDSSIFIEKENKEKKEKETNKETELFPEITDVILSVRTDDIDYKKVVDLWNNICGNFFGKVVKLTKSRKDKIKVRAAEIKKDSNDLYETLTRIFTLMTESDFFRNKWHPSFDWVMENDKNYIKVLEGNYNRKIVDINGNSEEAMLARLAKGEQYLAEQRKRDAAFRAEFGSIFD